jgi:tetratricopeptide (TPR) repeat protein
MRLLHAREDGKFSLAEYLGEQIPPYAILSHTWGEDHEEVSFKDLTESKGTEKTGYKKLQFCGTQAAKDGLEFFWIDTCCIDKSSSAELTEAINSMFRWYSDAAMCYVYLSDVSTGNQPSLHTSRWFTRGWTLQELLAPATVEFFSAEGNLLGDKVSMMDQICNITRIPAAALQGDLDPNTFTVDERLSWAENRITKRSEDAAYSLLGLFGVHLPLIYGEGRANAFLRLRREMDLKSGILSQRIFFNTPFRRDADFIDRGTIFDNLQDITSPPGSCVALFGLGGVGKSQIAIEYTYRLRESSHPSVFWVHSGTQARFKEGYQRIAGLVKMNGWDNPKLDTLQLVYDWLCNRENGKWTMVVDNADDDTVFFDRSTKALSEYIPQSENGRILITSRNRDLAYKLTGNHRSIIEVKPMNESDAMSLLGKKLGPDISRDNAPELLNALDYMPLAITQAAAYIQQRAPRMSVKQYLQVFRKSERDQSRLLTKDLGDARRDGRASNSIMMTWQTSFEHIASHMPTAASLLSLMCLFDRQGIPETLLQGRYTDEEDDADFEDDIQILSSYSLVEASSEGNFEMHRLVQTSTRKWLEVNNQLEHWKEVYTRMLNAKFSDYGENYSICKVAIPHVQAAIDCRPSNRISLEMWAALLHSAGHFLIQLGQYELSEKMTLTSLETRQRLLGPEHSDSLYTMNQHAIILHMRAKYTEAEEVYKHVLATRKRLLGAEHNETLTSMNNLASVYSAVGQMEKSEKLNAEVIKLRKKALGPEHPYTLDTMNNQVCVYVEQGRFEDAVQLGREVAEKRNKLFGSQHRKTVMSKGNLAEALAKLGKLDEAEVLIVEVLERSKDIWGDHPATFGAMSSLSEVYRMQKKWKDAQGLALQVRDLNAQWLGPDHPATLTAMGRLGMVYHDQMLLDKAEAIFTEIREGIKKMPKLESSLVSATMNNLARTWMKQGKQDEAISLMEECVRLREKVIGPQHPVTVESANALNEWRLERVRIDG